MGDLLLPAAQYLRVSTENQQYSLHNQSSAIARYAYQHGYTIVATFSDRGKSGLTSEGRLGLRTLLEEVLREGRNFATILVLDISRWGRFQDPDESGHYEFICRNMGVNVVYCAEPFDPLDPYSVVLKALKRTMAAEFSRQLSAQESASKQRLVRLGFRVGGAPGYGFRRCSVNPQGGRRILENGEERCSKTERIIFVPGPPEELKCVRRIYRLALQGLTVAEIRNVLNRDQVPFERGKPWSRYAVRNILTNPKLLGDNVWGKTSCKLRSKPVRVNREAWVRKEAAFAPLVSVDLFTRVQQILRDQSRTLSDEEVLENLRKYICRHSNFTTKAIEAAKELPTTGSIGARFGCLHSAFQKIGYNPKTSRFRDFVRRSHSFQTRYELVRRLVAENPDLLVQRRAGGTWNLNIPGSPPLALSVCESFSDGSAQRRWRYYGRARHRGCLVLVCFMDRANHYVEKMRLYSGPLRIGELHLAAKDRRINVGIRVSCFAKLSEAICNIVESSKSLSPSARHSRG